MAGKKTIVKMIANSEKSNLISSINNSILDDGEEARDLAVIGKSLKPKQIEQVYEIYNRMNFLCNYDINELIKKSQKFEDFTVDELAAISYFTTNDIDPSNYPMLYRITNGGNLKRIYTYDLPYKLLRFFRREINTKPNENGWIEKTQLPSFEKFCAMNGITMSEFYAWTETNESLIYDELKRNKEVCSQYLHDIIVNGAMLGHYNGSFSIFLAKNETRLRDKIEIDQTITHKVKQAIDVDNMTYEEMVSALANPQLIVDKLNKSLKVVNDD